MNSLYLECYCGISGDMTVAALLDLGSSAEKLTTTLKQLDIEDEYEIKISKVLKSGLEAMDFDVILKNDKHLHERNLDDVTQILNRLTDQDVLSLALKIFRVIAEAEAKVHGKPLDQVHFHEVGAVDSIIDIVATACCIVDLKIKDIYVSTLYEGQGFVKCAHGLLPVPVPAVLNIIKDYDLPLKITDFEGELITPTGAGIVAALKNKDTLPEQYTIKKIGLGAGKRYPDRPSVVRALIIEGEDK